MRICDLPPPILCRNHLLGEHRELHAVWDIITLRREGYRHHPEVKRWVGKLKALYSRHDAIAEEMLRRKYRHLSRLQKRLASGSSVQRAYVDTPRQQLMLLRKKKCKCNV
jgi:hypothetical protein